VVPNGNGKPEGGTMTEKQTPQEPAPIEGDLLHKHSLLELFETLSLNEWWDKVNAGLKMPADSGEYKWAKLQIQRLWAPVSAVVVPVLALLICLILTVRGMDNDRQYDVIYVKPEEIEELEDIKEIPPEEVPLEEMEPSDVESEVTGPSEQPGPGPVGETALFSPQPAPFDSVAMIRSPFIMKGIYGSRRPGSKGSLRPGHGGTSASERAIYLALRWLKKHQESDGCWTTSSGGYPQAEHNGAPSAMTGLAVLTYLAHNELPDDEEFGPTVERAIRWLIEKTGPDGRISDRRDNNNYGLPISAYAMAEAYGMTRIPMIKDAATRAISTIVRGQNAGMMWNYDCNSGGDRNDMSYSPWCVQALKAAQMAGLEVDGLQDCMRKAVEGLKLNWTQEADGSGSFTYTRDSKGATKLSSAGVLAMQLLGAGNQSNVQQAMAYMKDATCNWAAPWSSNPIYYWYYYTQDRFQANDSFKAWDAQFNPTMCKNQIVVPKAIMNTKGKLVDIGYWKNPSNSEHCKAYVYNTTLCALSLTVYYRYLPTYKQPQAIEAATPIEDKANDIDVTTKAVGAGA
jgi:hypothetical protein